jgi:hypothetical protein
VNEIGTSPPGRRGTGHARGLPSRLGAIAWALFFIWIGIALLAGIGMSTSLLVVGCITLLVQLARKLQGLRFEAVWLTIGVLFVLGGLSDLLGVNLPLLPILILVAGVVLLISALTGKRGSSD